jgi:hypothetical protein
MPSTFKHSGDLGDIIYSLPAVRALGGGVLYLDPDGGKTNPAVTETTYEKRTSLTAQMIEAIKPLLLLQPYIQEVRPWSGQKVDYDLDQFRRHVKYNNISDSHLIAFSLPVAQRDTAWLKVDHPIVVKGRPLVISRTTRYHGNYLYWVYTLDKMLPHCIFVGYPKEHEIFEFTFKRKVEYYPTPDILTLARVIAGAEHFVGNQSFSQALAEAMKKPLTVEVYKPYPAAVFQREGATYV